MNRFTRKLVLGVCMLVSAASAIAAGASSEQRYFRVPEDGKGRQKVLERWRRRIKLGVDPTGLLNMTEDVNGVVHLNSRLYVCVGNGSKWPLDFSSASGEAKRVGLVQPGGERRVQLAKPWLLRDTASARGRRYKWKGHLSAGIAFSVTSGAGKKLWFRIGLTVPVYRRRREKNVPNPRGLSTYLPAPVRVFTKDRHRWLILDFADEPV